VTTRILLVEDDDQNAALVTMMCERDGYEVVRSADGMSALFVLWSERVDVVLMDLHLPEIDGTGLLRIMRSHHSFDHVPVIALTGLTTATIREELVMAGAASVLHKPFARKELMASLAGLDRAIAAAC
jgi:DNA-binding response OmpR family regulator